MNIVPRDRQIAVIAALSEGMSIRSGERLTGIHRDIVMRLGAQVGRDCAALLDVMMRDLPVSLIELAELWSYVGKKQRKERPDDSSEVGDQYVFIALDATNKRPWRCSSRCTPSAASTPQSESHRQWRLG